MTEIVVAQRMWQRRGTTAEWVAANPILAQGEIGVETFAPGAPVKFKIGDGVTTWEFLQYQGGAGGVTPAMRFLAELGAIDDSDPGAGLLKWNHSTPTSATMLYLDDTTSDGSSLVAMWPVIDKGGFVYIQNREDENHWQIWEITSVVDATGYVKLGVSPISSKGAFVDGNKLLVTIENGPGVQATTLLAGTASMYVGSGNGSPEGVVTAGRGAIYTRLDGGPHTTLYIKEAGVGNTGWAAYRRGMTPSRSLSGTSYTLVGADVGYRLNADTVRTLHLPETVAAGLIVDDVTEVRQSAIDDLQFVADGAVVLEYDSALFSPKTRYKGAVVEVKVVGVNTYSLTGALADA